MLLTCRFVRWDSAVRIATSKSGSSGTSRSERCWRCTDTSRETALAAASGPLTMPSLTVDQLSDPTDQGRTLLDRVNPICLARISHLHHYHSTPSPAVNAEIKDRPFGLPNGWRDPRQFRPWPLPVIPNGAARAEPQRLSHPIALPVTALPEYGPAVDVEHLTVNPLPVA
jgi:hypothetical protein